MRRNGMRWLLGYIAALCALVLIVCQSIAIPTFFMPFYSYEFDKNRVPETIQVDKDELMTVTRHLTDYMRGKQKDLVVTATVNGVRQEFFNQKEKDHMVDVRALFDIGFKVRNVAFWLLLLLLLLMILLKIRAPYVIARCLREVLTGFLLLAVILTIVVLLDFSRAFDIFHMLFFTNDLWQLNPQTDLLVNIVPIQFFMDISIFIGVLIASCSLTAIIISTIYLRRASRVGMFAERT